jgi:ATP/ADP translocase
MWNPEIPLRQGHELRIRGVIVDTVVVRAGDALAALVVWAGSRAALPTRVFATFSLFLISVWVITVFAIGRETRAALAKAKNALP